MDQRLRVPAVILPRGESTELPTALNDSVPTCALSCLEQSIISYWSGACANLGDFGCLCDNYGSDGYTIGEIALICTSSPSCPKPNSAEMAQAYTVCSTETKAVPATHSVLTATVLATTIVSQSVQPSTLSTSISASHAITTSSASVSTAQQASATTLGTTSAPSTGGKLSSGQAAGVAVGVLAAVLVTVAVLLLCLGHRRSKSEFEKGTTEKKRETGKTATKNHSASYEFACGSRLDRSPSPASNARAAPSRKIPDIPHPPRREQNMALSPDQRLRVVPGGIVVAHQRHQKRRSADSARTVSRLLPDKPQAFAKEMTSPTLPNMQIVRTPTAHGQQAVTPAAERPAAVMAAGRVGTLPREATFITAAHRPSHRPNLSLDIPVSARILLGRSVEGYLPSYYMSSESRSAKLFPTDPFYPRLSQTAVLDTASEVRQYTGNRVSPASQASSPGEDEEDEDAWYTARPRREKNYSYRDPGIRSAGQSYETFAKRKGTGFFKGGL